ncbi:TonB-dependent receptor [Moheibacter sediminis]|uniref:Outer membrane receptor proteins, mostly Fe transport n=1 Tax=Moheibacter sediminis TaxID=1434700 RepID=A0A1W2AG66_9FLAO|nr:TonB-dependent receptor [Moheibacter sediminis]SMC59580.1 Outer membrane receptor proteins, mostly Fe transport [Moheibacter sediminis]
MKKSLLTAIFTIIAACTVYSQTTISGTILKPSGLPAQNINVTLVGTYDGASTDEKGFFTFETEETGEFDLELEGTGFVSQIITITIPIESPLEITIEEATELDAVVFGAGTMKAVGNTNQTVMSSLDIVTTAGSDGDIIAAMQTLPGTNNVSEDGRLFIRGGEGDETSIFIDRLRVFQPYSQTAPNTPARGRYSPFLFKGINFSTGGYDAPFGQALSGILALETQDFPTENSIDLGFMSLGVSGAFNKVWEKDALSASLAYYNLWPAFKLLNTRDDWRRAPEGYSGETVYRHQFKKGLYKSYAALEYSRMDMSYNDINQINPVRFSMDNTNFYWNNSYVHNFSKKLEGFIGFSIANADTNINQSADEFKKNEFGLNVKAEFDWKLNSKHNFRFGSEFVGRTNENQDVLQNTTSEITENLFAAYAEYTWYFIKRWGIKAGVRSEHSDFVDEWNVSPRVSLAYKPSKDHNLSIFYGEYFQSPMSEIGYYNPADFMKSKQYLLNYFYQKEKQIVRVELYQKDYEDLVRNDGNFNYTQNGNGYARGIDVFWRNRGSHIKNMEYWVSYSYIDTKRLYKDFPVEAQPSFVANHNLSVVGKYWIQEWRSQIGFTYQFGSGRPYTNPNTNGFLSEKTKTFNTINLSWAYLIDQQKILYISFSNPMGFKNVNGYNYSYTPNDNGIYDRMALKPSMDRFFFIGFFWTISENKERNQLDTL